MGTGKKQGSREQRGGASPLHPAPCPSLSPSSPSSPIAIKLYIKSSP
ncbi:hypothetical protein H1Q63_01190 [Desmonostoc muscorum CCALA 125]|nr:hypothetical protein [Desmonostoc muscorum CCALA 125]